MVEETTIVLRIDKEINFPDLLIHISPSIRRPRIDDMVVRDTLFKTRRTVCTFIVKLWMAGLRRVWWLAPPLMTTTITSKHEFTRPDKEQDRIDHIKVLQAQTGLYLPNLS